MSKILLTGGSGFIGSHFHHYISHDDIINFDLVKPSFMCSSEYTEGDIRKTEDLRRSLNGKNVTTILSLAAKHHDFGIGHDEYFDTNEDGTAIICGIASEYNIKQIIFFSSVAVYGIRKEATNELTVPKPDSPYGASKLAGEKVIEKWVNESPDRKALIIRPTLVFGANNMANMHNLIRQIDSGLYFHLGMADNIKSIAYVENLVQATLYLKDKMKPGLSIYNYADEPQLTTREISDTIAKALDKKIRVTIPKTLGIMMGIPFDLMIKLTGKNFPISTSRIRKLGTSTHHTAKKILSEGFLPPFSTVEGLKKMVEWYKKVKRS
jgi:GlcNAc-P-P-Und epimerase